MLTNMAVGRTITIGGGPTITIGGGPTITIEDGRTTTIDGGLMITTEDAATTTTTIHRDLGTAFQHGRRWHLQLYLLLLSVFF